MGKKQIRGHDSRPVKKLSSGAVGFRLNDQSRETALQTSDTVTDQRSEEGWIWVQKGGTAKQIKQEKLQKHLDDGWKTRAKK